MASQPMRIGTRGSPLALWQARHFASVARAAIPALAEDGALEEHVIATSGDKVQDKRLADIGGKGLFAKEIHEALAIGALMSRCIASRIWKPNCRRALCSLLCWNAKTRAMR